MTDLKSEQCKEVKEILTIEDRILIEGNVIKDEDEASNKQDTTKTIETPSCNKLKGNISLSKQFESYIMFAKMII